MLCAQDLPFSEYRVRDSFGESFSGRGDDVVGGGGGGSCFGGNGGGGCGSGNGGGGSRNERRRRWDNGGDDNGTNKNKMKLSKIWQFDNYVHTKH